MHADRHTAKSHTSLTPNATNCVQVYDVATSKLMATLEGHHKPVRSLAFTPGGWWASGSSAAQVQG